MMEQDLELEEFVEILDTRGVQAALRFLNGRMPHRFTGIYRFDPPTLRNLYLFDRENPELTLGSDAPLRETYCSIVGDTEHSLRIDDARTDPRTNEHPARESTISYSGVLLRSPDGRPFGTLCHFDLVSRHSAEANLGLMERAAEVLTERGLIG